MKIKPPYFRAEPTPSRFSLGDFARPGASGFTPAWFKASGGSSTLVAYGNTFSGVPSSGLRQATVVITYRPTEADRVAGGRPVNIVNMVEFYFSGTIMYFRKVNGTSYGNFNFSGITNYITHDYAIVFSFDTNQALAGNRVKITIHDLTTGTSYAVSVPTGLAQNEDLQLLNYLNLGTFLFGKTATPGNPITGGLERVQIVHGKAANHTDLSNIFVGTELKSPADLGMVPAVGGGTLADGITALNIHGTSGFVDRVNAGLGAGTVGAEAAGPNFNIAVGGGAVAW